MSTAETYELWCLVEGDDTLFPVIASSTTSIGRLKVLIKDNGINAAEHAVLAKDLTIWKVDLPFPPKNERKHLTGKNALESVQLDEVVKISNVWPEQPPDSHLQVIVQIPVATSGKRPRDVDSPDLADLPWLKEFHLKIWNREDLKPQLFRRVELTYAHYLDLQNRLKLQHSDRDSPDYDARNHDVLRDKLDFLRSIRPAEALSPRHPDNNDDRVGGDDDDDDNSGINEEIKSLFPFTLSYLDVSYLDLKNKVTSRLPLPLLLRQEYDYISKLIDKNPRDNSGSVIVSGQPGTGKTAYLYLRIIEQMIKGCSFLFQVNGTTVYHVSENGVEVISSWPLEKNIVAFVDGDKGDYKPNDFLLDRFVQLVVASSPKGTDQPWRKQGGHGASIKAFVAKLWSLEELIHTGIFLHHKDISFALLSESTTYFGCNPRRCFEASFSVEALGWTKWSIQRQIERVATKGSDHILQLINDMPYAADGTNISHSIFQIFPSDADELPSFDRCKFDTVSRWALDILLGQYDKREAEALASLYYRMSPTSGAGSVRGRMFEKQVLNYLDGIEVEHPFSIRRLIDSERMQWLYRGPIRRFAFTTLTFTAGIADAVQKKERVHLVPINPNFGAVDSILYDPNDPNTLTCIQITRNERHPIAVSGLKRIQGWLIRGTLLAGLRPSKTSPWRFIFFVPSSGMESTFKLQKFCDDTLLGEWASKVQQYVMRLEEQTIFGKEPDWRVKHAITPQPREQQAEMMVVDNT
ncbi:hypothetical protein BJV74DRAFT_888255 [Russula compacta]|nr:hypothetical protein BJV74DRAFT_888255 [Russula compacta]